MKPNYFTSKSISLIAVILLLATNLLSGQISVKPIAHWSFDEGTGLFAADESGNGHDASLINMDETAWVPGKMGTALQFDAIDDKVSVEYDTVFDFKTSSFTYSMWLKLTDTPFNGRLVTYGTFNLQQSDFNGSWMRVTVKSPSGSKLTAQVEDTSWVKNDWVLLTVVRKAEEKTVSFYANDQLIHSHEYGDAFLEWDFGPAEDNPYIIGANTNPDPAKHQGTNGAIDDLRVYDKALTQEEISSLYQGTADILVAHWNFDEGTGNTANDISGNGNHATLINMDESSWTEGKLFSALNFDGVDDKLVVDYTDDFDFKTSPFTYSMWLNMSETPYTGRFVTYGTFALQQSDFNGAFVRINIKSTSGSKLTVQTEDTAFIKGDWVLLSVTRDTTTKTVSFYANTQLVYSQTYNENFVEWDFVPSNDTIVIGANTNPDPAKHQGAKGKIDELRVYSKALNLEEITSLFAAGSVNYYDLTVNTEGNGTVTVEPAGGTYPEGSVVTLTAIPDADNHFENWSGDLSGTQVSKTITMDGDKTVTAHFAEGAVQYKLKINTVGDGFVVRSTADTLLEAGTEVILTAVPMEGNDFQEWTGTFPGYDPNLTFLISEDTEITAVFVSSGPDYDVIMEMQAYEYTDIFGANLNKSDSTYLWTNNPGYTGDGFIDFANEPDTWVEWTINMASAGKYFIIFRYAHGKEDLRPSKIELNGSVLHESMDFPATGAWSIWKKIAMEADLNAGDNILKLTALGAEGMVNFDMLQIANFTTSVNPYLSGVVSTTVYPNPVSDQAVLSINLRESAELNIDLYDMAGKKVKHLARRYFESGENIVQWNADDLKSGLYVGRISGTEKSAPVTVLISVVK